MPRIWPLRRLGSTYDTLRLPIPEVTSNGGSEGEKMANLPSLEELWRQSVELNIRYYSALGRLTTAYLKDLTTLFTDLRESTTQTQAQPAAAPSPSSNMPQATAAPSQQAGVMVLEGEAGGQALGVFLVANNLGHEVSAQVAASPFVDANGRTVEPLFRFDPEVVTLAPNEQLLVRVTTVIDTSLEPGVRYSGEFTIPELAGTRIPIVLRRRLGADEAPADSKATADDGSKKTKSSGRSSKTKGAESDSDKDN
jgi:hypothetical protein